MSQNKHMRVYVLRGEYRNAFGIMTRVGGVELDLEMAKERLDELNTRSKKYVYEIETVVVGARSAARYPQFAAIIGANLTTKTRAVSKVVVVVRDLSTKRAAKPDDGLRDDEVSGATAVKMLAKSTELRDRAANLRNTFPLRGKPINTLATLLADSLKLEQSKPWPWPKAADFKKPRQVLAAY